MNTVGWVTAYRNAAVLTTVAPAETKYSPFVIRTISRKICQLQKYHFCGLLYSSQCFHTVGCLKRCLRSS